MKAIYQKFKDIPKMQKYRYFWITFTCMAFLSPIAFIPALADNPDLCGKLCMRRFYLYFPGMSWEDFTLNASVAFIGVTTLLIILVSTFFFGRIWCSFLCPIGGFPELVSRMINDRWKIEFRALPQVPIRYGYFAAYLVLMPMMGISACVICNFITIPRLFGAFTGTAVGLTFILSTIGLVNLTLLFVLGFFANKGRAYCQFLCPIGAMDGLVNRLGANLKFTHRIRVERDRCSGCNKCAKQCMTGAIKMVDRIAVVDQLSCMSCNECADVCDWDAIMWTTASEHKEPKRIKKNVTIHPQPSWTGIHKAEKELKGWKRLNIRRVFLWGIAAMAISFVSVTELRAAERYSDPDGCLTCHDIPGLEFLDKTPYQGKASEASKKKLLRNASINSEHYYSSLHGSIPCTDCHRKITDYPHNPENGKVDCASSCHLEEPSKGEPYSHKPVVEEYETSVHGKGWSQALTAVNRIEESHTEQNPSCRRCHSNTLYIPTARLEQFQQMFNHTDSQCGSCHQGEVWLDQFSGHILRRLVGARWSKSESNIMCNDCHDDLEFMAKVKRHSYGEPGKEIDADHRFIASTSSYDMTLHARLLKSGVDEGASCIECHATSGFKHGIRSDEDPLSATHVDQLGKTCSSEGCHSFANNADNLGFNLTDLHDVDFLNTLDFDDALVIKQLSSWWQRALIIFMPLILFMGVGSLIWTFFGKKKKQIAPIIGASSFDKKMLNIKKKAKKKPKAKKPAPQKPTPQKPAPQNKADLEKTDPKIELKKDKKEEE